MIDFFVEAGSIFPFRNPELSEMNANDDVEPKLVNPSQKILSTMLEKGDLLSQINFKHHSIQQLTVQVTH